MASATILKSKNVRKWSIQKYRCGVFVMGKLSHDTFHPMLDLNEGNLISPYWDHSGI